MVDRQNQVLYKQQNHLQNRTIAHREGVEKKV